MSTLRKPATYSRKEIASALIARFDASSIEQARSDFSLRHPVQWFVIDNLLPDDMAREIHRSFPQPTQMRVRKSLREHKHVAAQMNRYDEQAEEALFAFQVPVVVDLIAQITGLASLHADPALYAGGLSLMTQGNFLNPHLDNSHNNDRSLYRVLNLLHYVSPGWDMDSGGHLELWPHGVKAQPITIPSLFNRLVVMTTGPESWHSVSCVLRDQSRCCVSNYYFSPQPIGGQPYFRVTSFRGRPEQPVRDLLLRFDSRLRQSIRKLRPQGLVQTSHIYQHTQNQKSD